MKCIFGEKKVGRLNPLPQVLAATNDEPTQDNSVDKDIETSLVSFSPLSFFVGAEGKKGLFYLSFFLLLLRRRQEKKRKGKLGCVH